MLNPNGIDPSPENQLFATAQRDFLPSPVGRGLRSGIPTWYADTVIAMTLLFPPLARGIANKSLILKIKILEYPRPFGERGRVRGYMSMKN